MKILLTVILGIVAFWMLVVSCGTVGFMVSAADPAHGSDACSKAATRHYPDDAIARFAAYSKCQKGGNRYKR